MAGTPLAAQGFKYPPTTWWPDPDTGLMWTGTENGTGVTQAEAAAGCVSLVLDGYSGWHLPSKEEYEAITIGYSVRTYATETVRVAGIKKDQADLNSPVGYATQYRLKFEPVTGDNHYYWTTTVGSAPQDFWTTGFPNGWISQNASSHFGPFDGMCARPMEPDLLALAKRAHPPHAITGTIELKATLFFLKSEDDLNVGQFQQAIDDAQQGLSVYPKAVRGMVDIARSQSYLGQLDAAAATLKGALKLDGADSDAKDLMGWVQTLQKQGKKDKNVVAAWNLMRTADQALTDKRYQDAADAATKLTTMEPKWPDGFRVLGLADFNLKQWQGAVTALKKASKLDDGIAGQVARQLSQAQDNAWYAAKYGPDAK